jgi:hypothetical protein
MGDRISRKARTALSENPCKIKLSFTRNFFLAVANAGGLNLEVRFEDSPGWRWYR